ncbi:MAG: endolytic transglycosylase MltG [Sediminibacterium sp.]
MKKVLRILRWIVILPIVALLYIFFVPDTTFSGKDKSYEISKSAGAEKISVDLEQQGIIRFPFLFRLFYGIYGDWSLVQPGRYTAIQGQTIFQTARQLRNSRKSIVKLVINRIRLKEDFAKLIAKQFTVDSSTVIEFIQSNDSLRNNGVDTSSFFTMILPDTYEFYRNSSVRVILAKLREHSERFWLQEDRIKKASALGLTPSEVYTLASVVEEETNDPGDRKLIASVYLNRLKKRMPLQACPTIKYALRDFSLTRIYEKYLTVSSPYNTYQRIGLPPGPICTPVPATIDLVLDAPNTDYLYFVAKSDFSGYHHFSASYSEHQYYARLYQKALTEEQNKKATAAKDRK